MHHGAVQPLPPYFGLRRISTTQERHEIFHNRPQHFRLQARHVLANADQTRVCVDLDNGGAVATRDDRSKMLGVGQAKRAPTAWPGGTNRGSAGTSGSFISISLHGQTGIVLLWLSTSC
jgi:hypothetical protein